METTITEALQELKTINARIVKKQEAIGNYTARDSRIVDPLEKSGGSAQFINREMQAIHDLRTRLISIRSAIQVANLSHTVTVQGVTRTVADWLTWRREVSQNEKVFLTSLLAGIRRIRTEAQLKGGSASRTASATEFTSQDPPNIVVNVDETNLMKNQELVETILGELDGKLSLFNAVNVIEI